MLVAARGATSIQRFEPLRPIIAFACTHTRIQASNRERERKLARARRRRRGYILATYWLTTITEDPGQGRSLVHLRLLVRGSTRSLSLSSSFSSSPLSIFLSFFSFLTLLNSGQQDAFTWFSLMFLLSLLYLFWRCYVIDFYGLMECFNFLFSSSMDCLIVETITFIWLIEK